MLHVPTALLELDGQPVEELGVGGAVADDAEVFGGPDDSRAEDLLPVAVDGHACGEGVLGRDDPAGEAKAVGGGTFGKRVQDGEGPGGDGVLGLVVLAAEQHAGGGHRVHLLLLHVGHGAAGADGVALGLESGEFLAGQDIARVASGEIELIEGIRLGGRTSLGRKGEEHADRRILGERTDFIGLQLASVDADILDLAIDEVLVLAALADADGDGGSDGIGQLVDLDAGLGRAAVDEDLEAGGFAGAVVGHEDMLPFARLERVLRGDDLEGILRPRMDQVDGVVAIVGEEVPAAEVGGLIHAGDDGLIGATAGNSDPGAVAEGLVALEVGDVAEVRGGLGCQDEGRPEATVGLPGRILGGLDLLERALGDGEFPAGALVEDGVDEKVGVGRADAEAFGPCLDGPFVEVGARIAAAVLEALLHAGDLGGNRLPAGLVLVALRDDHAGVGVPDIAVETALGGVPEIGGHRVEIPRADRIELVVVADRTVRGEAEPDGGGGLDSVAGVVREVLVFDGATLVGGHVAPVESGGDALVVGGLGEEVTGDLVDGELVEGLVAVEGADDPVAVGPHLAVVVEMEAVGIGVAGGIEPEPGAVFAPGGRVHEAADVVVVGFLGFVADEGLDFLGLGGEAGQVEGDAACEGSAVGFRGGFEAHGFELRGDEGVDGIPDPGLVADGGCGRAFGFDESPVRLPRGAFLDPKLEGGLLLRLEDPVRVRRGHEVVRIRGRDPGPKGRPGRVAGGQDGAFLLGSTVETFLGVEAQARLALAGVRAVAVETVLGKERPDIPIELQGRPGSRGRRVQCEQDGHHEGGPTGQLGANSTRHRSRISGPDHSGVPWIHLGMLSQEQSGSPVRVQHPG